MASLGYHEALIRRGNALHVAHVPTEPARPGGVIVALSFVGVCGTDLQILNGSRPDTAEILGHEGLGTIVAAAGQGALSVGEQVVFNPAAQLSKGRILGHNTPGLFQKYVTVDAQTVADGLLMPANSCNPLVCGILTEPLGTVVYAHELISNAVSNLRTAVVFGGGPVGLLAAIYLDGLGVRVLLVHRTQARIDTVAKLKILSPAAMMLASDDLAERIMVRNRGRPVDAVLICTTRAGAPSAVLQAIKMVRDGGCIDLVTSYPETVRISGAVEASALTAIRSENICGLPEKGSYFFRDISGRRVAFSSHRGTSHAHLKKAAGALSRGTAAYMRLVTHVLPLQEAAGAIQSLSEAKSHFVHGTDCIKLVIDLTGPNQAHFRG